jgi:hypothetical protein
MWRHEAAFGLIGLIVVVGVFVKYKGLAGVLYAAAFLVVLIAVLLVISIPVNYVMRARSKSVVTVAMADGWRLVGGKLFIDATNVSWMPSSSRTSTIGSVSVAKTDIDHFEMGRSFAFVYNRYFCECVLRDGTSLTFVGTSKKRLRSYVERRA